MSILIVNISFPFQNYKAECKAKSKTKTFTSCSKYSEQSLNKFRKTLKNQIRVLVLTTQYRLPGVNTVLLVDCDCYMRNIYCCTS